MPSGITFESLNFRLEGSYLILFLLPFGVSMMTSTGLETAEEPFLEAVTGLRFSVK